MRAVLLVLLLALNLVAFAAVRGWLGQPTESGEALRLGQQFQPERIFLPGELPPGSVPALLATDDTPAAEAETVIAAGNETGSTATAETDVGNNEESPAKMDPAPVLSCFRWSGLSTAEADTLRSNLQELGIESRLRTIRTPTSWWVRVPPQGSMEQASLEAQALRAKGVSDLFIVREPGPSQFAISLGVFQTETRARIMLDEVRAQGISNADVEARLATRYEVEAELPADLLSEVNRLLARFNSHRSPCQ